MVNIHLDRAGDVGDMATGNESSEAKGGTARRVETRLESSLDSVDAAENAVVGFARELGVGEDDLHGLGMAVRETMVNAVVHGNRYSMNKHVTVTLESDAERLVVTILDEGDGFDLTDLPDPLAEENLLRQSGRGILLMQAFVDDFSMRKAEPRGTEVRLVKHLNQD